jgi:hypothetical protein
MQNKTTIIDGRVWALCTACNEFKYAHAQEGHSIESGIRVAFYGGYADYYDPFEEENIVTLDICHECTNKVLKLLNLYDDKRFFGGHPTERDAEPCCDNCWIPIYENDRWAGTKSPRQEHIVYHHNDGRYNDNPEG